MRLILLPLALMAVAGCRPDVKVEGVTGHDLRLAFGQCMGIESGFDKRLACTAAVYGGAQP